MADFSRFGFKWFLNLDILAIQFHHKSLILRDFYFDIRLDFSDDI